MSIATKVKQMTDTGYMMVDKVKNVGKKVIDRLRGGDYTKRKNKEALEWNKTPEGKATMDKMKSKWYGKFFE